VLPRGRGWDWKLGREAVVRARRASGWTAILGAAGALVAGILGWYVLAIVLLVVYGVARYLHGTFDLWPDPDVEAPRTPRRIRRLEDTFE